jgi:hypothetical protein
MFNSAKSPWKPLICNFPLSYDNFLQMQSLEELARATAEVSVANPGWNATVAVEEFVTRLALNIEEALAAVVVLYPEIFVSGLPAKYYMHAQLADVSRSWVLQAGQNILCAISDLFNHAEPSDIIVSYHQQDRVKQKGDIKEAEVVLLRGVAKGAEIFNCTCVCMCAPLVFSLTPAFQPTQSILASRNSSKTSVRTILPFSCCLANGTIGGSFSHASWQAILRRKLTITLALE